MDGPSPVPSQAGNQDPPPLTSSVAQPRPPHIVEPSSVHTHSFIFLHGRGSNGQDLASEFLEASPTSTGLLLPQVFPPGTRFIFPTATRRRPAVWNRSLLNMWFDVVRLQDPEYRNETQIQGLVESAAQLGPLIQAEIDDVGAANVILGGISNGSAMSMALLLALGPGTVLGSYIGFCSYMPFRRDVFEATVPSARYGLAEDDPFAPQDPEDGRDKNREKVEMDPAVLAMHFVRDLLDMKSAPTNSTIVSTEGTLTLPTPVFLGHGALDEKKPPEVGKAAARTLRVVGHDVTWKLYPEPGHWYQVPEGIDDMVEFIKNKVGWEMGSSQVL